MGTVLAVGLEDGRKVHFMCINPEAMDDVEGYWSTKIEEYEEMW